MNEYNTETYYTMKFQREGQEKTLSESDWDRRMQRDQMEMADNKRGSKGVEVVCFFFNYYYHFSIFYWVLILV